MRGTYNFYQEGRLVAASTNLITTEGRKAIFRYLAGQGTEFGRSISVGVGTTAPAVTDTALTLEFDRANVSVSSPNYTESLIVFKATLDSLSQGVVHEVGLWANSSIQNPNITLLTFDLGLESWDVGASDTTRGRLGPSSLHLTAAAGGSTTSNLPSLTANLADLSPTDKLTFTFFVDDANLSSLTLRLKAEDGTNYYEYSPAVTQGYNLVTFNKSELVKTGTLSFADIVSAEVRINATVTAPTNVYLDALTAVSSRLFDNSNTLISRSVLATPFTKLTSRPLDVEYILDVTV